MTTLERSNGHAFLDSEEAGGMSLTDVARPERVAAFEHWAYEVDTPFRPIAELLEVMRGATTTEEALGAEALDETEEFADTERIGDTETLEGPQIAQFEVGEDAMELERLLAPFASTEIGPVISNITPGATPFKGPKVQLDHWHCVSVCDPKSGTCTPANVLTNMTPDAMNPGFIDAADAVRVGTGATSLQERLSKLIVSKYGRFVTGAARKARRGTAGDRLRVALVDLSGKKLANPEFAGWGSTMAMQGVSTAKVAIVYALHQLLLDVFRESVHGKHTTSAKLMVALETEWKAKGLTNLPKVVDLIDIAEAAQKPVTVALSKATERELTAMFGNNNRAASRLILKLTLPYIASVLWRSGLHHPTRGGLWLTTGFGCHADIAKTANSQEHVLTDCEGTKGRFVWRHDPRAGSSTNRQNVTALSLATMFTLLAQGRLGTPKRSATILQSLTTACTLFWETKPMATLGIPSRPPAKCGVAPVGGADYAHDVTFVERGSKRYVAVALTRDVPDEKFFENLIVDLDGLI